MAPDLGLTFEDPLCQEYLEGAIAQQVLNALKGASIGGDLSQAWREKQPDIGSAAGQRQAARPGEPAIHAPARDAPHPTPGQAVHFQHSI